MGQSINSIGVDQSIDVDDEKLLLQLPKWKIWYTMIVLYVLFFLDLATRSIISPMFPILQKEFGLSDTQLGWLSTIVLAMVGLLSIPLSYVIDRWRRGKMISLMAIVWSIASLCSGFAVNFTQLLSMRAVLGVGEASFNSGGQSLIMAMIKKSRRATITGLWTTATSLGMGCGMLIGGWVALNYGWRTAFIVVAIPGIIFGIMAWFMPDYKNRPKGTDEENDINKPSFVDTMKDILKNKTLVALFISFGLAYLFINSLVYWLPTYFTRYMGMDVATAGTLTGVVLISALLSSPVGGLIGDRISRNKPKNKMLLCWLCMVFSLCSFVCAMVYNIWPLFIAVSFFQFMSLPVQNTASQEIVPFFQRATTYGVYIFCMFFLGGLWGPAITGMVSDASSLQIAFWINGAILFVACIGYFLTYRFFNGDFYRARKREEGIELIMT